jgi:hypothetical protein
MTEADGKIGVIRVEQEEDVFDFPLTVQVQYRDGQSELRTLQVIGPAFEERFTLSAALRRVTIRDSLSFYDER